VAELAGRLGVDGRRRGRGVHKLQYRRAEMEGNPWLRLLRREVEELVSARHGEGYLREQQARTELKRVNRELKQLRTQVTALEARRAELLSELAGKG
jgi:hypothetical protein